MDPRTPCIVGVARTTWHPEDVGSDGAPEPLSMWEEVARAAAADAGAPTALSRLGSLEVVYCQSWQYDDPPARLGARLGATARRSTYSGIGGSVPQVLIGRTAEEIAAGNLDVALVVGGEALATLRRLKKQGVKPDWSHRPAERRPFPFDVPLDPSEVAHGIFEAYLTFALFDTARRAGKVTNPSEHRRRLGRLLSPMTAVAVNDPSNAWFPIARSPGEIVDPTAENRMVAYPYTKLMTAIMDVDMAAAVLLASNGAADDLGVPADRRVYLRGWGYAEDPPSVAQRPDLSRSAAMGAAARAAFGAGGVGIDDVAHLDLYSCFASSIGFALDALDLDEEAFAGSADASPDRRATVTGGLPYHGGPGSNYMTHSIAALVEVLRRDTGSFGLASGVGMHMMKHAFGLWSTEPGPFVPSGAASPPGAASSVPITGSAEGPATVATYTVLHGRDGTPESAVLVCDLPDRTRCYARMDDPGSMAALEECEFVGSPVSLDPGEAGVNVAYPA